jgi:hypothetical protein
MRIAIVLLLAALPVSSMAEQQSTASTGDYAMDLGQVYGAIEAVKFTKDICDKAFPDYIQANGAAYQRWRARFKPFLQEMEKHYTASMWREAKGDPQKHMALLKEMDDIFMQYREGLKKQMMSDGPEVFRKQCGIYPTT